MNKKSSCNLHANYQIKRFVKFGLTLAFATLSTLDAKSLEQAIKNVDVSGFAWYRYDSGRFTDDSTYNLNGGSGDANGGGINKSPNHWIRVALTTKVDMGDGFRAVGTLVNNSFNYSFKADGDDGLTKTKQAVILREAYLQYDNADLGVTLALGRQNLVGIMWTNNTAAMMAKVTVHPTDGLNVLAFGIDSFMGPDDASAASFTPYYTENGVLTSEQKQKSDALNTRLYSYNLYGAAILGDFGAVKTEFWGAAWDKTATLYAVKLDYKLDFGEGDNFKIHANYLGNVIDGVLQSDIKNATAATENQMANGNLAHLKFALKVSDFDANLGGIFFGKKKEFTLNTIQEPFGNDRQDLYISSEIFYQKGSWAVLSKGQNTYGYFGAGYTLPADIRVGIKGVYGETKMAGINAVQDAKDGAGKKVEGMAEFGYKVNRNLNFLAYYSYLHTKAEKGAVNGAGELKDAKSVKNTVRVQAKYDF